MNRYFFALWPNHIVRKGIIRQRSKLNFTGRIIADANLHMTLLFLGKLNIYQQNNLIKKALKISCSPFQLKISQTGYFKNSRVFWIGPKETVDTLQELHNALLEVAKQCHIPIHANNFTPHITLAKKGKPVKIQTFPPLLWPVNEFFLLKSIDTPNGVHYEKVKCFTFNNDAN